MAGRRTGWRPPCWGGCRPCCLLLGEEEGGFGAWTWVRGAGVPAPDWPTGEDGEVQGAPWYKRRRHGARLHPHLPREPSVRAQLHLIPFEKLYYSCGHWLDNSSTHEGAWYWHWP